ncbi:multidrug effflux MFS transporter [Pullulanibacillus sp. KACC 23026]|uniref:multidrug effflux MFS transporter n=1 Tax=Pullulanibacillus sp. KACC 23026 TaxID=3028315 RepID=UPI0023AF4969|nr:multidrug effflux MFS transporter [Pullulanibacillus sp. KACC 23026]WEG14634.1 multidrug effflux MFS transporter [Pullulanibacillus sp. KACC 23026]
MDSKEMNHPLRLALLLVTFSVLGPFTFDMYLPSFPQIMTYFGTKASTVQLSLTACLLGLAVGQIALGALSDVFGRRKPLIIAMIIYFLSSIGCAFAPNMVVFILLRFIQGFSVSAGSISNAIVRDKFSGVELTRFFSLLSMMSSVGPLLAPLAGSTIISFSPWFGVFVFLGFLGLFLTINTTWRLKESLPKEKRIPADFKGLLTNFITLFKNKTFMGYALAQGLMMAGIFAYVSGTPFIYQKIYGVSPTIFSMLFALNGISLILGAQVVRRLAGRMSETRILQMGLSLAFLASIAVLIVVLLHGPLFSLVIPLFLFVASLGLIGPVSFTLAMASQGHIAGSASALLGVLPFLLGSFSSPLVGVAGEYSALPLGIILFTTSSLALTVYLGLVKNTKLTAPANEIAN